MTTMFWLVPLLALAILVGYVWGRSGLFSVAVKDFAMFLGREIVELVRLEPWFRWRGRLGILARGLTWASWGAFLFLLGAIAAVIFLLFATLLMVARFFRDGFRGPAPIDPNDPAPYTGGLGAFFYRLIRPRTPEMDRPARPKLVRRASAVTP